MKSQKSLLVLISVIILITFSVKTFAFASMPNSSNIPEITHTEDKKNGNSTDISPLEEETSTEESMPEPTLPVENEIPVDHAPITTPGEDTTILPTETPVDSPISEEANSPLPEQIITETPHPKSNRTPSNSSGSLYNLNPNLTYNDLDILASQLAQNLVGGNIPISNAKITGVPSAFGTFDDKTSLIGFNDGIVLSTGQVNGIFDSGYDTFFNYNNGAPSNETIKNTHLGENTNDIALLEFDIKPASSQLLFNYVLASEEYPEFLEYFDKFVLIVNDINYAKLPNGEEVTIGNVNHMKNSPYYRGITIDKSTENPPISPNGAISTTNFIFDGATVVLSVSTPVRANELNHIKIAIGDYKDHNYDSAVFIKAESVINTVAKPGELSINYKNEDIFTISRNNGTDGYISVAWTAYNYKGQSIEIGTSEFNDGVNSAEITGPEGVFKIVLSDSINGSKIIKSEASKPNYPPSLKLSGMPKSLYVGDTFNPKDYITVSDDHDDLTIDDISITLSDTPAIKDGKLAKSGTLKVKYTVTDSANLTAQITGTLKTQDKPKAPTLPQTGGDSSSVLSLVFGLSLALSGLGIYRKKK